ncbi:MAG: YraN family protein [Pseudobdellovibrionaceae bacterium]
MDPKRGSTDGASLGLRNISRGLFCEEAALQFYLLKGYRCLKRRWKSPFAEIDLLLRSPEKNLVLVEVKSVASFEYLHLRLRGPQKRRLERALCHCLEKDPTARLELAVVSQSGEVLIFDDIFS